MRLAFPKAGLRRAIVNCVHRKLRTLPYVRPLFAGRSF